MCWHHIQLKRGTLYSKAQLDNIMKYKGFVINKVPGFDCRPPKVGEGQDWVKMDIKEGTVYEVLDPTDNDKRMFAEDTVAECKFEIDRILKLCDLKTNQ